MNVEYAIPSRARAETLVAKTLPLLRRLGIPDAAITVFVAEDEMVVYSSTLSLAGFHPRVVEGALGVGPNRNAILDHYEPGARVVSVDDDMRDLVIAEDEKTLRPIEPPEWEALLGEAWGMLGDTGARIWGLYPVPNAYFMRPRISTRLTYIAAGLYGFVSDREPDSPLRVTLEDKEDFERSLQCYVADGVVVRFDFVSWRTEGYHGKGGMQADGLRTPERVREATEDLVRRFPGLVTLNDKKKSGWVEPRLRDRRPASQGTIAT